jgi:hypothetical protein
MAPPVRTACPPRWTHTRRCTDEARFLLAPGHAEDGIERVVQRRHRYDVVEKVHRVAALARRLDPRAEPA